eukprot:scaffold41745_cov176-Amphora_coffeaeformis.AAC.4
MHMYLICAVFMMRTSAMPESRSHPVGSVAGSSTTGSIFLRPNAMMKQGYSTSDSKEMRREVGITTVWTDVVMSLKHDDRVYSGCQPRTDF